MSPMQSLVAHCQYPGLKPFYAGTIMVRHGAPMSEVEAEAQKWLAEILPTVPAILKLAKGAIFMSLDEGRAAA